MSWGPEAGHELGGYRIIRELGRGGMGLVFEAEHIRLGRNAALKVLDPALAKDETFRERFVQESRLIAAIDHPNIIPIYDADETDGVLYIAMRYVQGEDLDGLIQREGSLNADLVIATLEQVAAALDAAHARDLVHRDVKPANILLDEPTGRVFLTDFGIAKHAGTRGPTRTGLFVGSVDYAPPEQIEGRPTAAAADVYALGCVLYQSLTGRRPFDRETDVAVIYAHLRDPAPLVTEARPDLPAALDDVVATALAKSEAERYASCGELVAAARVALGLAAPAAAPRAARTQIAAPRPAPAEPVVPSDLPVPPTPLVGRQAEVDAIRASLESEDVRLLTITGPGGTGKTRLALEVGRLAAASFHDGAFFVPLETIGDPGLVAGAIAEVLGVKEEGAQTDGGSSPIASRLRERLADARLLLILDNFEHVLPAATLVADLLSSANTLTVLVTSQAALRLQGEHEFPVPPLRLPPADLVDVEQLRTYPTVALFVQRARAVRPDFELNDRNAGAVAEICRRLDGLPLAIELAAPRAKALTPQVMLERLDDRLSLLTGGARDLPSRHQTLRGTIAWSYDLLDEAEQALFSQLSVFEGGWSLPGAEAVSASDEVLLPLESLVDKSLVRQREGPAGEPRFDLLQTIQEYARFKLIEQGELDESRRRHAEYYVALAEEAEPELIGPRQQDWLERLDEESGNLRAALGWSIDRGDLEVGLRIAGALTRFWSIRGHMSEGRAWLAQALAQSESLPARVRARALFAAAYAALGQGDYGEALAQFGEVLELAEADGDQREAAMCLAQLGWLRSVRGELEQATTASEQSLALATALGDDRVRAVALSNLADVAARRGDPERASELFEQVLDLRRSLGDRRNIANALVNLGRTELLRGDSNRAAALLDEGLALASEVDDTWGVSLAKITLGNVALRKGDEARASEVMREALVLARERGDKTVGAECLTALGALAVRQGDPSLAARLWGASERLREQTGAVPSPVGLDLYERFLASLADVLGSEAFEAERARGFELAFAAADDAMEVVSNGVTPIDRATRISR
jgi:predicted ATPase/Tfp pilus assembly protein PilF